MTAGQHGHELSSPFSLDYRNLTCSTPVQRRDTVGRALRCSGDRHLSVNVRLQQGLHPRHSTLSCMSFPVSRRARMNPAKNNSSLLSTIARFPRARGNARAPRPLIMVALCNRQTIIFSCCGLFFFFFFFLSFFFFPRLISAAADWMSAILPHMVWP